MRAKKGSDFERSFCKMLSRWWTKGERDDVFWRTSQSGGRATQRAKGGKKTYGSQGDVAAVDPIGRPFLDFFTVELKRGDSHGNPVDLFDAPPTKAIRGFEHALGQAQESARQAGNNWLLVLRRDRREPMAFLETNVVARLGLLWVRPCIRFRVDVNGVGAMLYTCLPLKVFLRKLQPADIISHARANKLAEKKGKSNESREK